MHASALIMYKPTVGGGSFQGLVNHAAEAPPLMPGLTWPSMGTGEGRVRLMMWGSRDRATSLVLGST